MAPTNYTLFHLYVYPNEECNLACKHCWITAKLAKDVTSRQLNAGDYRRIVDEAIPLGLGLIAISGGEALMSREETLAMIEHAGKHGVQTRIETNGTLIDDEIAKIFKAARTSVSVSLDGSTPEIHEKMRLVPGCFEETMRGLGILKKHNIPVEIIMSVCSENFHDLANVAKIAATMPRGRVKINPVLASGRGNKHIKQKGLQMDAGQLYQWIQQLENDRGKYAAPLLISAEPAFRSLRDIRLGLATGDRCGFLNLLGILANGNISFCGMGYKAHEYVFGNVAKNSLDAIWNDHPVLSDVRRKIPDLLEGICSNCVMQRSCQGACRAAAYETYGSLTAPSPGCQALYEAGMFPVTRMVNPDKNCDYTPPLRSLPVLN